jgi:hypothetical protein
VKGTVVDEIIVRVIVLERIVGTKERAREILLATVDHASVEFAAEWRQRVGDKCLEAGRVNLGGLDVVDHERLLVYECHLAQLVHCVEKRLGRNVHHLIAEHVAQELDKLRLAVRARANQIQARLKDLIAQHRLRQEDERDKHAHILRRSHLTFLKKNLFLYTHISLLSYKTIHTGRHVGAKEAANVGTKLLRVTIIVR